MKRFLAILALANVLLLLPLSAMALNAPVDAENNVQPASQGIHVQGVPDLPNSGDLDQQDAMGDPDELGGGFRNNGLPPYLTGSAPIVPDPVIDPLFLLLIQLI